MNDIDKSVPLARLLAIAYRQMIDGLHARLPAAGFTDVRPSYGFVLLAVRDRPTTIVDLARLLGVSKQAASKLVGAMDGAGYVQRTTDTSDARAKNIELASRGVELLKAVEAIYDQLESEWAVTIGEPSVERMRRDLSRVLVAAHDGRLPDIRPAP
ncbi:MAG TPA: MarR family transcriptional regulator [Ilumatobacteraceae bacterium]|nr:MarR family transcriptional regulator [Ilumatobacteraceae bacterium]